MKRVVLSCVVFVVALSASAQPFRTYVSGNGSDSNPACAVTSPCRTLAQALSVVAAGGEVIALDTAGFGANLTISKSVSILIPDGIYGAITTASGDAITISAGSSDVILIKGLNVVGNGTTGSGIVVSSGGFVSIDAVTIRGFSSGVGVQVLGGTDVFVARSTIRDGFTGIFVNPSSAGHKSVVSDCTIENMGNEGIESTGSGNVLVRDTTVSHAALYAFHADGILSSTAELTLDHCLASYTSNYGVFAGSGGVVRMARCTIIDNYYGIDNNGGTIYTWADNDVHGSTVADVTGTLTTVTKK
jgi:hypothetical protein